MNERIEKIERIEVRKLFIRVPATIFSDLERLRMMKDIDEIVSNFLVEEIDRRMNGDKGNAWEK